MSYKTTLKAIREATGLSSKEFGAYIGFPVKPTADPFRKIEKGDQSLSLEQAWMLAQTFNLTLPQIMGAEPIDLKHVASFGLKHRIAKLEAKLTILREQ